MIKHINVEQMEAAEINERPRIVITASNFYVVPAPNASLEFTQDQLLAVGCLMNHLKNSIGN